MIEWWNSLEPAMKALWAVTLSASLVFVIQTVMTFLGAAGDSDFDINTDADASAGDLADGSVDVGGGPDAAESSHLGSGMNLLTFRNFVNFLIGFGWTAILLKDGVPSTGLRMLIAIAVGIVLVVLVMLLFKWLTDMQACIRCAQRRCTCCAAAVFSRRMGLPSCLKGKTGTSCSAASKPA